jgi:hypothetical protein
VQRKPAPPCWWAVGGLFASLFAPPVLDDADGDARQYGAADGAVGRERWQLCIMNLYRKPAFEEDQTVETASEVLPMKCRYVLMPWKTWHGRQQATRSGVECCPFAGARCEACPRCTLTRCAGSMTNPSNRRMMSYTITLKGELKHEP